MKALFASFFFLLSFSGFAQLTNLQDIGNGAPLMAKYPGISGSPLVGDFTDGKIFFNEREFYEGKLALNGYENRVEYMYQGERFYFEPKEISYFVIFENNRERVFKKSDALIKGKTVFYEELKGKDDLILAKLYSVSVGNDPTSSSYGSDRGKAFLPSEELYLCSQGTCKIVKNEKQLGDVLSEPLLSEALAVIKAEKLKLKKEEDWLRLMDRLIK